MNSLTQKTARTLNHRRKIHAGGRPRGVTMPCGWCGAQLAASQIRQHFTDCPKRPRRKP